jgi:hypothetical protein
MALLEDTYDLRISGKIGDWAFWQHEDQLLIGIKYGEDEFDYCIIPVSVGKKKPGDWDWNGNREKPTLSPSILIRGSENIQKWHGFLRDGKLIEA